LRPRRVQLLLAARTECLRAGAEAKLRRPSHYSIRPPNEAASSAACIRALVIVRTTVLQGNINCEKSYTYAQVAVDSQHLRC